MKQLLAVSAALLSTLAVVPAAEATSLATLPAWSAQYSAGTTANELAVSADGTRVYVTGTEEVSGRYRAWVAAYGTETGVERWSFTSGYESVSNAVGVTPDGTRVIIAGWVAPTGGERNSQMSIWALDRSGANRWAARFTGNGADRGDFIADLVISPNGSTVYVTGLVWNENRRRDLVVAAYRTGDGRLRWRRVIDSGPQSNGEGISEEGRAIAVTGDGASVIVTGYNARPAALSNERSRAMTMSLAASSGATRWTANSSVADDAEKTPWGVDVAVHGSAVFVAGASWYYGGEESFATRHRLGDGHRAWAVRHHAGDGVSTLAEAIAANGAGAYLTGSASSGAFYVWSQRASDGGTRWATSSAVLGTASDIALAPGGARVYAAGGLRSGPGQMTFSVLGIDTADGSVEWTGGRSPGDAAPDEEALDLAIDPDGSRVYASGRGGPDGAALVVAFDL